MWHAQGKQKHDEEEEQLDKQKKAL